MGNSSTTLDEENPPNLQNSQQIKFYIHDEEHIRDPALDPGTSLNQYLRSVLKLTGTKGMCYEGGCGSCLVVFQKKNATTNQDVYLAVNSCLVPLISCNGWRLFTIEGVGNSLQGYHPIQETLAQFGGTQCGFCSPGMVMNMYALYESKKLTMQDVENSFGGNICRCTGYRPILSAFKSLCTDADPALLGECPDIEDFVVCYKEKCKLKAPMVCKEPFYLKLVKSIWIKVYTLVDLRKTLSINITKTYRLICGNTAQGVYPSYRDTCDMYIDIADVEELIEYSINNNSCTLGANMTLSDVMELFKNSAEKYQNFSYLKAMADHIDLVANVPVRNRGSLAGNLMIKHDHPEFPSDIFLILETVGASLTIVNLLGLETRMTPLQFLNTGMDRKILKSVTLPPLSKSTQFVSYKIMPRAQNTHANVNAGFLFNFKSSDTLKNATIVYGNIQPSFVHATQTEKLLAGTKLFDNSNLQKAYAALANELKPHKEPPEPSPALRENLAIALFYKAVLSLAPANLISPKNKSGGTILERPISNGVQEYGTNKSMYPVTEPVTKLEALAQTAGQVEYIMDMSDVNLQLYANLVLARAPANSKILSIDPTKALAYPGIIKFYNKDDIPGDNIFTLITFLSLSEEPVFCDGTVKYYGQPIGILVGQNQEAVLKAIDLVEIKYKGPNIQPVLTIREVLKNNRTDNIKVVGTVTPKRKGDNIKHVVKGTFDIYHQYHFHMETQSCNAIPSDGGLTVYSGTQWMDMTQAAIARVLNLPKSKILVIVKRMGGAYGAKITRSGLIACATALAAWKLQKPIKLIMSLPVNMEALGKRCPFAMDYEVGVDDKGLLQYLNSTLYSDSGCQLDEPIYSFIMSTFLAVYNTETFSITVNSAITDTPANTWCRSPGSSEGLAAIEAIMEHISYEIQQDPTEVRLVNLAEENLKKYFDDLKSWANIDQRKSDIVKFNQENRWKKKGLSVVPMNWKLEIIGPYFATVSIFCNDGSVQISHGGTESGQGINTKAAQTCAYKLGIPLDKITVLPSNSFVSANAFTTGNSITSEAVCYSIIQACDTLLERLAPYKQNKTWKEAVNAAHNDFVTLTAIGSYSSKSEGIKTYQVYGLCAAEVLVDVLTGQHILTRVDLIEDAGDSINPIIDIGQIEGAFIMGLGYHTTEKIVLDYEGQLLTKNTWTYLPPGAKDIPVEFNVKIPKNNPNPVGVLHSKATGEPAFCLSISIPFAIRNALASARIDANGSNSRWFPFDGVTNLENVFLNSGNNASQYAL